VTTNHQATDHHSSAATHHTQAARNHREASRHYKIGKDYAHAAHQAWQAHGHTLQAADRGNEARRYYATHHGKAARNYPEAVLICPPISLEAANAMPEEISAARHHVDAADHHEQAALHHGQASEHFNNKDYASAAFEAQIALGHAQHALFKSNEAAKLNVERLGEVAPLVAAR
jgi:hypothetical protein